MKILNQTSSNSVGQLQARPTSLAEVGRAGLHPLGLDDWRDGMIYVPPTYQASEQVPLLLMLHGAGGDAEGGLSIVQALADTFQTIVLAVDSRDKTWDVIVNGYGPDITFIDQALTQTFRRYAINPKRIGIGGFSDGASYALSVGLTNGNLFSHILSFSPGFMAPLAQAGEPRIFISHGQQDRVLPIDRCSRRLVPQLQKAGYQVLYQEFDGPHTVPGAIAHAGMTWFTA